MSNIATAQSQSADTDIYGHGEAVSSFPLSLEGKLLFAIALLFSAFQVATAGHYIDFPSQVVRACHVGFLMLLGFPFITLNKTAPFKVLGWLLAFVGVAVAAYQVVEYNQLMLRAGDLNQLDLYMGAACIATVFLVTWFAMGPALPIICGVFLAYCFFGQYLPAPLDTRGYAPSQIIEQMAYGTEGIYGIPVYVSSSYIFLFILFGAFLEKAGMIRLFTDVSLGLVGHAQGGAAKVAVVASGFMGTISGSGVANVVAVGQFTIPMMKRFGYRSAFAGGVEATASMGGQIMPPVMGAVAFIMAETLGVEYHVIVKAAIIPAVLYFISAFWMVHLEAGKQGLLGMPKEKLPSAKNAIVKQWYLIIPLAALVWLLVAGYTPLFAGTVGLVFTVVLILGSSIAIGLPSMVIRIMFWIGLGLICASLVYYVPQHQRIWVFAGAIASLVAINFFRKGGRETLIACRDSLAEGAKSALPVGVACAMVGVIIGTMTLTGVANTFGEFVVGVGAHSLFLSLVLTMLTCIFLGMGIPTIPNYIITSTIAGPALERLGVPLIVSHMFVFYFGILADLTPPVALACFAAAPIAKESGLKISMEAIKIAAAGFVVPYMAVYTPALMLQDGGALAQDIGYVPAVIYVVIKALMAMALWGATVIGFLGTRLTIPQRLLGFAAAAALIAAYPVSDQIGFVLAIVFAVVVWRHNKAMKSGATLGHTAA